MSNVTPYIPLLFNRFQMILTGSPRYSKMEIIETVDQSIKVRNQLGVADRLKEASLEVDHGQKIFVKHLI